MSRSRIMSYIVWSKDNPGVISNRYFSSEELAIAYKNMLRNIQKINTTSIEKLKNGQTISTPAQMKEQSARMIYVSDPINCPYRTWNGKCYGCGRYSSTDYISARLLLCDIEDIFPDHCPLYSYYL